MSSEGMKVPEDLQRLYSAWSSPLKKPTLDQIQGLRLIERIAKAESERDRMREQVERLRAPVGQREIIHRAGNCQPQSPFQMAALFNAIIAARAALSEAPKEGR